MDDTERGKVKSTSLISKSVVNGIEMKSMKETNKISDREKLSMRSKQEREWKRGDI